MISILEILVFIIGGITIIAFAYSSFWSFSIRKALYEKIYRQRALWTGCFATYSALEIGLIVYFPSVIGAVAVNIIWLIVGSALLFLLNAWISSTVKVVISLDPFHKNRVNWRQMEKLVWFASAVIVAMNIIPALAVLGYLNNNALLSQLDYVQLAIFITLFVYLISVVLSYQAMNHDKLLKAYLEYFFYLLVVLMLNIVLSPFASALGLFIGPFALTDSLLILSAFFMYKMSKSLIPVITKPNF